MPFLRARGVDVSFTVYQGASRSLKSSLIAGASRRNLTKDASDRIHISALNKIDLAVEAGDRLAIIGANGAGKTTLLRVLAGIYEPTQGVVESSGRVTAMLSATPGLNTEATGRENVELIAMHMNIHPREIRSHIDEITEWTELGPYMDLPLRTYSSGMMLRLSFATSTCIRPDILLMDEWLGVLDASFLTKAHNRMAQFVDQTSIMVLASHSISLLEQWCTKAILLEQGRISAFGSVNEVAARYQNGLR